MTATDLAHVEDRIAALSALVGPDPASGGPSLRVLADSLGDPVYTTDAQGYLNYYNHAARRLWGWEPPPRRQQWCGAWRLYRHGGAPMPHAECPTAVALREARPVRGVGAIAERPDGTRVPFMSFPTPLRDSGGALAGILNLMVADSREAAISTLHARLQVLDDAASDPLPDSLLDCVLAEAERTTRRIADAPVLDREGFRLKLLVLRDRIAAAADPDFAPDALTMRLADALLRDLAELG